MHQISYKEKRRKEKKWARIVFSFSLFLRRRNLCYLFLNETTRVYNVSDINKAQEKQQDKMHKCRKVYYGLRVSLYPIYMSIEESTLKKEQISPSEKCQKLPSIHRNPVST